MVVTCCPLTYPTTSTRAPMAKDVYLGQILLILETITRLGSTQERSFFSLSIGPRSGQREIFWSRAKKVLSWPLPILRVPLVTGTVVRGRQRESDPSFRTFILCGPW